MDPVEAFDFIVQRIEDGLSFTAYLPATVSMLRGDSIYTQQRMYTKLETWIYSKGYQLAIINGVVTYYKAERKKT